MRKLVFGLALLVVGFLTGQVLKYRPQFPIQVVEAAEGQYLAEEVQLESVASVETEVFADPATQPDRPRAQAPAPALAPAQDDDLVLGQAESQSLKTIQRDLERLLKAAELILSKHHDDLWSKKIAQPAGEVKLLKALGEFEAALQEFTTDEKIGKIVSELEELVKQSPGTEGAKRAESALDALRPQPIEEFRSVEPTKAKRRLAEESDGPNS